MDWGSTMEIDWGSTGEIDWFSNSTLRTQRGLQGGNFEIDWGSTVKMHIGIHNENGNRDPQGKLI